jgi:hypothetical protein
MSERQLQTLLVHVWPVEQRLSQAPQLFSSVTVLVHWVPHSFPGDAQLAAQLPPWQSWPSGQALKHPPQWRPSPRMFTQVPPHTAWPESPPQFGAQAPATHASPFGQVFPQLPQLVVEVWVSMHPAAQAVRFAPEQLAVQVPLEQTWLPGHWTPQPPQLSGSDLMLMSESPQATKAPSMLAT